MEVGRSPAFYDFIGRLGNGELVRSRYRPLPYAYDRFPSGTPVTPPLLALPDWPPWIIDGDIVWLAADRRQLLDEHGSVAWDFEQLIPACRRIVGRGRWAWERVRSDVADREHAWGDNDRWDCGGNP